MMEEREGGLLFNKREFRVHSSEFAPVALVNRRCHASGAATNGSPERQVKRSNPW